MSCRLIQHIKHTCDYNPGGITNIYLLDIRDFGTYQFSGDALFNKCFVEHIVTREPFVEIGAVNESNFVETQENGIYKQDLTTFVRTLNAEKLSDLLLAGANKHLVAFRTSQGNMYCFGSDGGASLTFSQITGQTGEASGYQITINKSSVLPLFETDPTYFNTIPVLGTEDPRIAMTEDYKKAILISSANSGIDDNDEHEHEYLLKPDTYECLRQTKGSIFHMLDTTHPECAGFANWDWDKNTSTYDEANKTVGSCQGTYKTISIDEFMWTTESLIAPVSTEHDGRNSDNNWKDFTQDNINKWLGKTNVSYYDFVKHFGTHLSQYGDSIGYKNPAAYKVYAKRPQEHGYIETGWVVPYREALLQLIGQCPRHTGDFWTDLKEFVFCRPDQNIFGIDSSFYKHKNISGLSLTPLGGRKNAITDHKLYDFGGLSQIMTRENFYTRFVEKSVEDPHLHGYDLTVRYWHFAQARYCKPKSDDALGYRLYVDEPNDKIVMLSNLEYCPLPELARGLERGIALRWANRKHKTILKSWSGIKSEAADLKSKFTESA